MRSAAGYTGGVRAGRRSHRPSPSPRVSSSNRKNSRLWAQLRMLCCCGLDLMSIAPDAFAIAHELLPHAASALFLTDRDGELQAALHEDCPDSVRALCLSESRLFEGPDDLNVKQLSAPGRPKLGQLLAPPAAYYASNTYQLLVRGCGHHHTLDARLESGGRSFGVLALLREPGLGYEADDLACLARIAQHLEHAQRGAGTAVEMSSLPQQAMLVARISGELLFVSPAATALLDEIPYAAPLWPDRRRLPPAGLRLLQALQGAVASPWEMPACSLALPGGALEMRAQWLGAVEGGGLEGALAAADAGLVGITLTRSTPAPLLVWRRLAAVQLSPRQREVAFWMALGGGREAARQRLDISEAVLRDCVKAVYGRLGCSSQEELAALLRATPAGHPGSHDSQT